MYPAPGYLVLDLDNHPTPAKPSSKAMSLTFWEENVGYDIQHIKAHIIEDA